ncbi:flagellar export protein FliJ [Sulfurimonas sp.]
MKNKYSSLVSVKKNIMKHSERLVQKANISLENAKMALQESLGQLQNIEQPTIGNISQFLASRELLERQRAIIRHNEEWIEYANSEVLEAKEQLKRDMTEYEKFKYLELQLIEKEIHKQKRLEAKDLDEVALMAHTRKTKERVA